MSGTKTKILLTGASGYIGGSLLRALLSSPHAATCSIDALVRSKEHADAVKAFGLGVEPFHSDLADVDDIARVVSEYDVVIHCASAQHLRGAKAIVAGLARRVQQGKQALLIHTSGTSTLADRAAGEYLSEEIYPDTDNIYAVEKKDASYNIRAVDTFIVEAAKESGIKAFIVVPPTIYGVGAGPINRTSHQVPTLIRAALHSRKVQYVGKGASAWTHIHISDLTDLYLLLLDKALKGEATDGEHGYYFAETGERTWKQLAESLAKAMHALKLVDSDQATPFPSLKAAGDALTMGSEEFANIAFGSNSRARAVRSRKLGWKPRHSNEHFFESLPLEIEEVLKEDPAHGKGGLDLSTVC